MRTQTILLLTATIPALLLLPAPAGAQDSPCDDALRAFKVEAEGSAGVMTPAIAEALARAAEACRGEPPTGLDLISAELPSPLPDNTQHKPRIVVRGPSGCATGVAHTTDRAHVHLRVVTPTQVWDFQTFSGEGTYTYHSSGTVWKHKLVGNAQGMFGLIAHDNNAGGVIMLGPAQIPADSADALGNCQGGPQPCEGQGIALWDHGFALFADGYVNVCRA